MSDVHTFAPGDQHLIRYLLGLLPDEEAERLDEASIVDDDVAWLCVAESDLVDAYISGTLTGETLARFETFYLSSPARREKVRFAERFLGVINRATAAQLAIAAPSRTRIFWPMAAAVFVLTACGLLIVQDVRLRQGLTQARHASAASDLRGEALVRQLEQARLAAADTRQALERAQAALIARESSAIGHSPAPPAAVSLALVLMPQTRAMGRFRPSPSRKRSRTSTSICGSSRTTSATIALI